MDPTSNSPARREDVLRQLTDHLDEIKAHRVRSLALFGSVARDEAGPESDVDVLIELERPAGYFAVARIQRYLEAILGHPVDVATRGALTDAMRDAVDKDLICVA